VETQRNWYALSLRVSAPFATASEITDRIGIEPTSQRDRGEPLSARNPDSQRAAMSLWVLDSGLERTAPLEEHFAWALETLQAKESELRGLAGACEIDLFVGVGLEAPQTSLVLDARLAAVLGKLGIEVIFDVYAPERRPAGREAQEGFSSGLVGALLNAPPGDPLFDLLNDALEAATERAADPELLRDIERAMQVVEPDEPAHPWNLGARLYDAERFLEAGHAYYEATRRLERSVLVAADPEEEEDWREAAILWAARSFARAGEVVTAAAMVTLLSDPDSKEKGIAEVERRVRKPGVVGEGEIDA
jgi:hypothetical protein